MRNFTSLKFYKSYVMTEYLYHFQAWRISIRWFWPGLMSESNSLPSEHQGDTSPQVPHSDDFPFDFGFETIIGAEQKLDINDELCNFR